jgi:hypothetical protein
MREGVFPAPPAHSLEIIIHNPAETEPSRVRTNNKEEL